MNAAEFKAALPEPHTILGLRLLPLSLGRYRLLKRFNCPFVEDDQADLSANRLCHELFFALVVCGLPVREFKRLLDTGRLQKECARFGKRARKEIRHRNGFSIFDELAHFKRYLDDGTAMPWKVIPRAAGIEATSVSHWSHSVEVTLRSKIGWTVEEIDEESMAKALCDFFKYLESENAVSLVTHEDFAELEKVGGANADILLAFEAAAKKATN